jgi:hypothetical protein
MQSRLMIVSVVRLIACCAAIAIAAATAAVAQSGAADVTVTATYKGKGVVDDKHPIWVFIFDHAAIANTSRPLANQAVRKNGETVTFPGVTGTIYALTVYDPGGSYSGDGPPPNGLPVGMYSVDKKAASPIKPGQKVAIVFDDSRLWQGKI